MRLPRTIFKAQGFLQFVFVYFNPQNN